MSHQRISRLPFSSTLGFDEVLIEVLCEMDFAV
jgi:hypothetical protein